MIIEYTFRYTSNSSTERLLASSSSPSLTEATSRGSHHQNFSSSGGGGGTSSIGTQSTNIGSEQSRYSALSPTPDGANPSGHSASCYSQQSSKHSSAGGDKYHHQLSKSVQSYSGASGTERGGSYDHLSSAGAEHQFIERSERYSVDRFGSGAGVSEGRFQTTGSDRYHCTTTGRYSPARGNADKYLSLPKPKDRYNAAGRISNSCAPTSSGSTDRSYTSTGSTYVPPAAHTPVERLAEHFSNTFSDQSESFENNAKNNVLLGTCRSRRQRYSTPRTGTWTGTVSLVPTQPPTGTC